MSKLNSRPVKSLARGNDIRSLQDHSDAAMLPHATRTTRGVFPVRGLLSVPQRGRPLDWYDIYETTPQPTGTNTWTNLEMTLTRWDSTGLPTPSPAVLWSFGTTNDEVTLTSFGLYRVKGRCVFDLTTSTTTYAAAQLALATSDGASGYVQFLPVSEASLMYGNWTDVVDMNVCTLEVEHVLEYQDPADPAYSLDTARHIVDGIVALQAKVVTAQSPAVDATGCELIIQKIY